jgi:hypothetical protein
LNLGLIRPGGFERKFAFEIIQEMLVTPGPHAFAVRECTTRQLAPSRPPHPRLTFRDDRDTPLPQARRDERNI